MNLDKILTEEYQTVSGADILENKKEKNESEAKLLDTFLYWLDYNTNRLINYDYRSVSDRMREKKHRTVFYSKEDIKNFSIAMCMYEDHPYFIESGIFLSYLVNQHYKQNKTSMILESKNKSEKKNNEKNQKTNCNRATEYEPRTNNQKKEKKNDTYEIITEHFSKGIDNLGYKNIGAHVHITGNAGNYLGADMIDGSIFLTGNAESVGDLMTGGTISVQDTMNAGFGMKKGNIYIRRNTYESVGEEMNGGTIHINGEIVSLLSLERLYEKIRDNMGKGEIYHKCIKIKRNMTNKEYETMLKNLQRLEKIKREKKEIKK